MTFGFLVGSRNFIRFFWVSWEDFIFTRVGLYPLCCQILYHNGISMIVAWFTFFTDLQFLITKIFRFGYDCTSTSSAGSPFLFRLQADIAIWVFREVSVRHCACPSPVPLLLATPVVIHEKNWKCLVPQAQGFTVAIKDYFHRQIFSELLQPVRQVMQQIALYFFVSFIKTCVFGFCWFMQRVSPLLLTHNLTSLCCWIFPCWSQYPAMKMLKK